MSLLTQIQRGRYQAALPLLAAGLLVGCNQEKVQVYEVGKQPPAQPQQGALPDGHPPMTAAGPKWNLPAGWFAKQGDAMRVGSFGVTNAAGQLADISVIPLSGVAGGELSNVNRWRGQVGLPPVKEEELAALWESVPIGGGQGKLMDLAGTNPAEEAKGHILAAMLPEGETTWFFKMTGAHELVAAQKPNFLTFLKSVEFGGGPPLPGLAGIPTGPLPSGHPEVEPVPAPAAGLPSGHPPISGGPSGPPAAPPTPAGGGGPAGWVRQAPKPMQSERFNVKGDAGEAEATLSELSGEGGGALANVNRWRQQIGLPAIGQEELTKLTVTVETPAGKASVVDITNDATKKRVMAAILPKGGRTHFYKLMGDAAVVGNEKGRFIEYVRGAK